MHAARPTRDHPFFVRAHDAHGDATAWRGNHRCIPRVARLVQFEIEEARSFADARADGRAVRTNASEERADLPSCTVTKVGHGFRRPNVSGFRRPQVARVGADCRNSEQPGFVVSDSVTLRPGRVLVAPRKRDKSRIETIETGAHHQPRRQRELPTHPWTATSCPTVWRVRHRVRGRHRCVRKQRKQVIEPEHGTVRRTRGKRQLCLRLPKWHGCPPRTASGPGAVGQPLGFIPGFKHRSLQSGRGCAGGERRTPARLARSENGENRPKAEPGLRGCGVAGAAALQCRPRGGWAGRAGN